MSSVLQRKAQPNCMFHILRYFSYAKCCQAPIDQLVRLLIRAEKCAKTTATDIIYNAIQDGLLVASTSSPHGGSPRGRMHESRIVRLPNINEIQNAEHDFYCFECHLPGMLQHCTQCARSFHRLCYRKDADRPNYTVPSAKLQKNRLPAFSSDDSNYGDDNVDEEEEEEEDEDLFNFESDLLRASSSLQALNHSSSAAVTPQHLEEHIVDSTSSPTLPRATASSSCLGEGKPKLMLSEEFDSMQCDTKAKLEVVCLGEVRPPDRKRTTATVSYKSEATPSEDEDNDINKELCTCCRLLKSANMRNPPNFEPDELCHLVNYTFSRNKSWLVTDALSYIEELHLPSRTTEFIKRLLFKIPLQSLETIASKLQNNKYIYLMEFFVDILDIQHNIGVFFGSYSNEMESSKWFVRDIAHDLSEIRRCPDCFRYSHERSNIWFAKPCVQRHELVFAKHSSFPYWPAKVIRVLPNNKYDVRFFGGTHSRGLIDVKYIKPIDSDMRSLKLGNSQAIKKAMQELRYHQVLSQYPPTHFSFHANREQTECIMRDVLGRSMEVSQSRRGRKRKQSTNTTPSAFTADSNSIIECAFGENLSQLPMRKNRRKSLAVEAVPAKRVTRSADAAPKMSIDMKKIHEDLENAIKIAEGRLKKNEKLEEQIQKLKQTIKKYEIEKKILKRKQWCYWCLNEAIYLCCFKAAYCSEVCQSRHWKDGHSKVCKNQEEDRVEPTAATSTT